MILVPWDIVVRDGSEAVTMDGVRVVVSNVGGYKVNEPILRDYLDSMCREFYGMPWGAVRAAWVSRLGHESDFWCKLKLRKI